MNRKAEQHSDPDGESAAKSGGEINRKPDRPASSQTESQSDAQAVNQVLENVARYFSLLSEPVRLRIIHTICDTEKSVTEIVEATGANQANVSRHLSLLYNAGVLARRKNGNFVYYAVSDPTLTDLCRTACTRMAVQFDNEPDGRKSAIALAGGFDSRAQTDPTDQSK